MESQPDAAHMNTNLQAARDNADYIEHHSRAGAHDEVAMLLRGMAAEIEGLRAVAAKALHEMCHTTAPRNSFTDVVDELDAILHPSNS